MIFHFYVAKLGPSAREVFSLQALVLNRLLSTLGPLPLVDLQQWTQQLIAPEHAEQFWLLDPQLITHMSPTQAESLTHIKYKPANRSGQGFFVHFVFYVPCWRTMGLRSI